VHARGAAHGVGFKGGTRVDCKHFQNGIGSRDNLDSLAHIIVIGGVSLDIFELRTASVLMSGMNFRWDPSRLQAFIATSVSLRVDLALTATIFAQCRWLQGCTRLIGPRVEHDSLANIVTSDIGSGLNLICLQASL
jgi:hypothetical protein